MINLTPKQRRIVMAGCYCLMFSIAAYGLSLSTIQGPILASLNGSQYFSTLTIWSSIAVCVMTPIGGRLIDMIGIRKLMIYAGTLCAISGLVLAFVPNLWVFLIFRIILGLSSGAYSSLPYILVRQIYPADQSPKIIGYLTMVLAIGGLAGSFLAGWFVDLNMMSMAIAFPVIALVAAVVCIGTTMPDVSASAFHLDWPGIILLTLALAGNLMGLSNGGVDGWFSLNVILSFAIGIVALVLFLWWENRSRTPLIPMQIFKIKEYSILLVIGFTLMFYSTAASVYLPMAVQDILQASNSSSGLLQMPRTIATILLPGFAGAWVVRKSSNIWKALALSAFFIVVPFGFLVFTGVHMPLWFMMTMMFLIGMSESFRSVGLTPAAQSLLKPSDMGIGTSMIGFILTLSGSIASAFFGMCYNSLTMRTPGIRGITDGVDTICLLTAVVAFIGLLIVLLFFRPAYDRVMAKKAAAAASKKEA